jgi:hypothetical protein
MASDDCALFGCVVGKVSGPAMIGMKIAADELKNI